MGEVIYGVLFGKDREIEAAWKAVEARLDPLLDYEILYISPAITDRWALKHQEPMWSDDTATTPPSDCELKD